MVDKPNIIRAGSRQWYGKSLNEIAEEVAVVVALQIRDVQHAGRIRPGSFVMRPADCFLNYVCACIYIYTLQKYQNNLD